MFGNSKFLFQLQFFSLLLLTFFNSSYQQKKICSNPNGTPGICVSIYYCPSLTKTIQKEPLSDNDRSFLLKSRCDMGVGPQPQVCCTTDESYANGMNNGMNSMKNVDQIENEQNKNKNQKEDGTTLPKLPNCGIAPIDERIYNGKDAALGEFPWMALLEYKTKRGEIVQNCGGSLINSRYILTAAHCLTGKVLTKVGQLESVRLGEHDLRTDIDCTDLITTKYCADRPITVEVEEIIPHENYNDSSIHRHNDIGLIRLKYPITFTDFVSPVCLPSAGNLVRTSPGQKLLVSGWGRTTTAAKSDVKQKLLVPVVGQDECINKFATQKLNVADSQLCAGGVFYEDSCDGDSGGPLMKQVKVNWMLEGVVSFGYRCGLENWPAIYTRVSNYEDWIKSKLKP